VNRPLTMIIWGSSCFLALARSQNQTGPRIRRWSLRCRHGQAALAADALSAARFSIYTPIPHPPGACSCVFHSPSKGRYPKGAPIAVHMLSAIPRVNGSIACLSEQGFIDVGFLCPGAQYKSPDGTIRKSGGSAFPPNPQRCVEPLADVMAFATGKTRSLEGRSIQDYAGDVKALVTNTGVIGWSFGGNLAVLAMARHSDRFPRLQWYVSWESPFLGTTEDRGSLFQPNPFYDASTGKIEFTRLRYSPEMPIWVFPPMAQPPWPGWPHGGLYLDGDGNGVFDKDADFAFFAGIGGPVKFYYSPLVIREAAERKVFGAEWPKHIATVAETEECASQDDPLAHVLAVVQALPHLSVLVFESKQNHVIDAADHPQSVAQVNAWIDAGAHWVRFNPDSQLRRSERGKEAVGSNSVPCGQEAGSQGHSGIAGARRFRRWSY
jgi:pimeloyl-ACP methyl ester carboxylesterase